MSDPWLCWCYYYAVGLTLFAASFFLILRTGSGNWSLWTDRRLLLVLVAGVLGSAAIHGFWIMAATS